jgi:hypothetical protein
VKIEFPINLNISGGALKSIACSIMGHKDKVIYFPAEPPTKVGIVAHPVDVCLRCGRFKGLPMTYKEWVKNPVYIKFV